MPYRSISLVTIFYLLLSSSLHADCSREDIQFYLGKGFTQEQITQLCSAAGNGEAVPDYKPYQQQVIIYRDGGEEPEIKDGLTKEEREAVSTLKTGGEISALRVTPETVSYSAKSCITSVNSPSAEDRYRDCIEVDFVVQRKDLLVKASGKRLLFFGNHYVLLEGVIDAKPKRSFDDYPIEIRRSLKRNFEWKENGKKTSFPVSGDYSVTRIVNAFRTLADTYGQTEGQSQVTVADNEQVKEVVSEPKKEKEKRWWNPFD